MRPWLRSALVAGMAALAADAWAGSAAEPACADFLGALRIKPRHVEFIACARQADRQGKPLRALYRVAGLHAASAEASLGRTAHLARLRRSCCQWDGPGGWRKAGDGRVYTVRMTSPETEIDHRRRWREIPFFEIAVETPSEDL